MMPAPSDIPVRVHARNGHFVAIATTGGCLGVAVAPDQNEAMLVARLYCRDALQYRVSKGIDQCRP